MALSKISMGGLALALGLCLLRAQEDSAPSSEAPGDGGGDVVVITGSPPRPVEDPQAVLDRFQSRYKGRPLCVAIIANKELTAYRAAAVRSESKPSLAAAPMDTLAAAPVSRGGNILSTGSAGSIISPGVTTTVTTSGKILDPSLERPAPSGSSINAFTQFEPPPGAGPIEELELQHIQESFAAPFASAGASIVDWQPPASLEEGGGKPAADVAVELQVRKRHFTYSGLRGEMATTQRLAFVATAFDLHHPGRILGQVNSERLFGFDQPEGRYRQVPGEELISQTSLALMRQLAGGP